MQREPLYKIVESGKQERKSYKDVKKYDVARFEYGDYDNWVNAIILDIKLEEKDYGGPKPVTRAAIHFTTTYGMEETCYSSVDRDGDCYFDIIGKAVKLKKDKLKSEGKEAEIELSM